MKSRQAHSSPPKSAPPTNNKQVLNTHGTFFGTLLVNKSMRDAYVCCIPLALVHFLPKELYATTNGKKGIPLLMMNTFIW